MLGLNLDQQEWREQALCAQTDPEAFYPEQARDQTPKAAKRICQQCPVIAECLEFALETDEPWGVWGGKTPRERRKMKPRRPYNRQAA